MEGARTARRPRKGQIIPSEILIGIKSMPRRRAPVENRSFRFSYLLAHPRPHHPFQYTNAPRRRPPQSSSALMGTSQGLPTLPHSRSWGLHSPWRVHKLTSPSGPNFPKGCRPSQVQDLKPPKFSARIQNVTFVFRASPSFQISPEPNQRELRNARGPRGALGVVFHPPRCVIT